MSMGWRRDGGVWRWGAGKEQRAEAQPYCWGGVGWEGGLPGAGAGGERWEEGNVVWGQEVRVLGV